MRPAHTDKAQQYSDLENLRFFDDGGDEHGGEKLAGEKYDFCGEVDLI